MKVFTTIASLQAYLKNNQSQRIGFVPTMGALHQGHLELIKASKEQCDITVCSIFVNPIQFNEQQDFENYPKTMAADKEQLEAVGCEVLFCPTVEEMYPSKVEKDYDFGPMTSVMEGEHRPGHFNGVAAVIERFFEIIDPDYAYFGEKDFQQLAVVRALTIQLQVKAKIVGIPIVREASGLAMSSRNQRLTPAQLEAASTISEGLSYVAKNNQQSIASLKEYFSNLINANAMLELEYFSIADGNTMEIIDHWEESDYPVAFTAVKVGAVRLIDNMTIIN